jgi:ubiquinol-cytochrome c reductase cytochrome b subunit
VIDKLFGWLDDRLHVAHFTRSALNKIFPDNWSFMLGEIALYCFVILVLTGIYLTFFFVPSARDVVYNGSYKPLVGQHMSEAYQTTVKLSFDVRAGLVFRQMHHWAALIFVGAVLVHLLRIFFTGAFRRPREINWIIGVSLLILVMFNGFAGYSLPDDLLSGTGLRIGYSIALAVPVIGTWIAFLLFGGEFPAPDITSRLYVLHIFLIPAFIGALLGAHLAILWRQKHTQFPGPGRTEDNIVGSTLWPTYAARSIGLFAGVFALIAFLGGLAQINPIWLYGPFKPAAVTTASQPDWYMGWLEGALRLAPGWRIHVFGYTISELFWPGVVLPTITFGLLYLWPFMERWVTHDTAPHQLLDRPRNRPIRTAIGIASLTFYVVLFLAGSQDIGAQRLATAIPTITQVLRLMLAVLPPIAAVVTWKVCRDLSASDELEAEKERIKHRGGGGADAAGEAGASETPPHAETAHAGAERRSGGFLAVVGAIIVGIVRLLTGRRRRHADPARSGRS